MARSRRHPREVRERAVGLVCEHQSEYASQWEAIVSIAGKVGVKGGWGNRAAKRFLRT